MADTDYLAPLSVADVVAFYRRLAASIKSKFGEKSLAAKLLLHWLDGNGKKYVYSANYVRNLSEVRDYLRNTARPIFLSKQPTPAGKIGGIKPRIKGIISSNPPGGPYDMHLEGNVEAPVSAQARGYAFMQGLITSLSDDDKAQLDILYALHGFTVVSEVTVSATKYKETSSYNVAFTKWTSRAVDEYHWDPKKHIEVPNPDYQSKAKGAIAPSDRTIIVYHKNAIRVEQAGMAHSFFNESEPWNETDASVVGPERISVA